MEKYGGPYPLSPLLPVAIMTSTSCKMEKKKHSARAVPKSYRKIVERGKIDTPNTHIQAFSLCSRVDLFTNMINIL
jgi:hypothetical protein